MVDSTKSSLSRGLAVAKLDLANSFLFELVTSIEDTVLVMSGAGVERSPRLARFRRKDDKEIVTGRVGPRISGEVESDVSLADTIFSTVPMSEDPSERENLQLAAVSGVQETLPMAETGAAM